MEAMLSGSCNGCLQRWSRFPYIGNFIDGLALSERDRSYLRYLKRIPPPLWSALPVPGYIGSRHSTLVSLFRYNLIFIMFFKSAILFTLASIASFGYAQTQTGDATFYETGLGSCGIFNTDSDFIVAVSAQFFDTFPGATANPNLNPVCNRQLTATTPAGKSVTVTVTDRCAGCQPGDIDLSPAAFDQLADPSVGRIHGVTWSLI
ncbi:Papain inhibitor [Grifola frondosa]|uniref:Papain inhibitor n=1 Tax=Grifola frondosa TaxID=5627 RepID=A0A1C7MCN0_GRIFR|nr:Papain inhibitor [Grifola frondosa]